MAKKTHNLHFDNQQWAWLVNRAAFLGISVAELIRQIIEQHKVREGG